MKVKTLGFGSQIPIKSSENVGVKYLVIRPPIQKELTLIVVKTFIYRRFRYTEGSGVARIQEWGVERFQNFPVQKC